MYDNFNATKLISICKICEFLEEKYKGVIVGIMCNPHFIDVRVAHGNMRSDKLFSEDELLEYYDLVPAIEEHIEKFIEDCKKVDKTVWMEKKRGMQNERT